MPISFKDLRLCPATPKSWPMAFSVILEAFGHCLLAPLIISSLYEGLTSSDLRVLHDANFMLVGAILILINRVAVWRVYGIRQNLSLGKSLAIGAVLQIHFVGAFGILVPLSDIYDLIAEGDRLAWGVDLLFGIVAALTFYSLCNLRREK